MSKTLFVNGDSFVFGDGLENPKKEVWATKLGEKLSMDVVNLGESGGSNHRIMRTTTEWILDFFYYDPTYRTAKDLYVIITWSSPDRIELRMDKSMIEKLSPESKSDEIIKYRKEIDHKLYTPIVPVISEKRNDEFHKYWINNFYDRFGSLETTAHCIYHTQQLLESRGINYDFCMSFDNFLHEMKDIEIWKYINKDRFIRESMWEITDTDNGHPNMKDQNTICKIFYERYKSQ
tara:strand:- start:648 stop:1349 length:702 start_codon:yes stop_codon:yes gene_type:complete